MIRKQKFYYVYFLSSLLFYHRFLFVSVNACWAELGGLTCNSITYNDGSTMHDINVILYPPDTIYYLLSLQITDKYGISTLSQTHTNITEKTNVNIRFGHYNNDGIVEIMYSVVGYNEYDSNELCFQDSKPSLSSNEKWIVQFKDNTCIQSFSNAYYYNQYYYIYLLMIVLLISVLI